MPKYRGSCRYCSLLVPASRYIGSRYCGGTPDIFLGPVSQNLLHLAAACHRQIHAARLAVNMAELQASFPDGWVVNDRQKASGVRHDSPIKEGFVVIEQVDQVNVAIKVRILVGELQHHPA